MDASAFPTLDPELAPLLELLPDMTRSLEDVDAARAMIVSFLPSGPTPGEELLDVTDLSDPPVRVYRPKGVAGDLPGLLYLHGGGFCLGSVATEHPLCVQLALALQCVIVSVEYRLAPEHPYPAGLDDCYAALVHLAQMDGVDPRRVAVHGLSAGGGLAAATVLKARDLGTPAVCFQSLGIPELDDRLETPSMQAFTGTPLWSRPQAVLSWQYYLGGRPADAYAAPARAEDLAGLPPTYLTTMELDPLRDEGLTYAMRLLAAGVSVELHSYPGTFHGAQVVRGAAVVDRMEADLLAALRRGLGQALGPSVS